CRRSRRSPNSRKPRAGGRASGRTSRRLVILLDISQRAWGSGQDALGAGLADVPANRAGAQGGKFAAVSSDLVGLAGPAEQRQALFEVVCQQRQTEQVMHGPATMLACRLCAQLGPVIEAAIAAAEPRERDEIDLLVRVQCADEGRKLAHDWVILVILQNGNHAV